MINTTSLELSGHSCPIARTLFDSTGKYALTVDRTFITNIWNSKTGIILHSFKNSCALEKLGMTRDGKLVYSLSKDGNLCLREIGDTSHSQPLITINSPPQSIKDISVSRDSRYMLTASHDHRVQLWSLQRPACITTLEGHTESVYFTAFNKSGSLIATASDDKTIRVWQVDGPRSIAVIPYFHQVNKLKFDKTNTRLTITSTWRHLKTWDLKQLKSIGPSKDSILRSGSALCQYLAGEDKDVLTHPNSSFTRICTYYNGECRLWDSSSDLFINIDDTMLNIDNPFNKHGDRLITIQKSDPTKARILTDIANKHSVAALVSARHTRLGASSPAQALSQDLCFRILQHLKPYSFI